MKLKDYLKMKIVLDYLIKKEMKGIGLLIVILVLFLVLSWWTDRSLDYWLTTWKGYSVNVNGWISALFTLCSYPFSLTYNIFTEIYRAY